jgi:hypothetical protein
LLLLRLVLQLLLLVVLQLLLLLRRRRRLLLTHRIVVRLRRVSICIPRAQRFSSVQPTITDVTRPKSTLLHLPRSRNGGWWK